MLSTRVLLGIGLAGVILCPGLASEEAPEKPAVLWTQPRDISTRDLFYGQGGEGNVPLGPFAFVKEDLDGNSPKFVVEDSKGIRWKVKVGPEARPEIVVTRFVWAVGYSTDEDYFLPEQAVRNMPRKLKRGSQFVSSDGVVHDARWERMVGTKDGSWKWKKNPFSDTRELNGLRVLMALFNNGDMKDSQNTIYNNVDRREFLVGDLGATLGPNRSRWPVPTPKGDLESYGKSNFVTKVTDEYVDFGTPSWPMLFGAVPLPPIPYWYMSAPLTLLGKKPIPNVLGQRWIGKHVPREDVLWMRGLLQQLTPSQIHDAFRAGGYKTSEAEAFSHLLQSRIEELTRI